MSVLPGAHIFLHCFGHAAQNLPPRSSNHHMTEPLQYQLVRAVRNHDDAALGRLYDQVDAFARTHAAQHAKLPDPLRRHAAARSTARALRDEWDEHVAKEKGAGEDAGPPLRSPDGCGAAGAGVRHGQKRRGGHKST